MSALALDRSRRVELACFAALAAFAGVQWASLVAHPPAGRVLFAVVLATGAGALLAAIARLEPRGVRWALAAAATLAVLCAGMVVVGLPARLLLPGHWDELGHNISRSLNGVGDVPVPYSGADDWTRLVILLAAPLFAGLAAFVAFWPTRRRVAGRIAALVLLVGLYLVAVAWATPVAAAGRRRAPPRAGLRLALAAGGLADPPHRRGDRGGRRRPGRPPGRRSVRHGARPARLPPLGVVQRQRPELPLGPELRPARLAAEGDPAAAGLQRAHALLEGDQPQHLRRHPLAALLGVGGAARPGRAAQVPPEGGAAPPRPGVRRPDQHRRPRAEQRLRDRRRHDPRASRRLGPADHRRGLGDEPPAQSRDLLHRADLRPAAERHRDALGRHPLSRQPPAATPTFSVAAGGRRPVVAPSVGLPPDRPRLGRARERHPLRRHVRARQPPGRRRAAIPSRPSTASISTCGPTTPTGRTSPATTTPSPPSSPRTGRATASSSPAPWR